MLLDKDGRPVAATPVTTPDDDDPADAPVVPIVRAIDPVSDVVARLSRRYRRSVDTHEVPAAALRALVTTAMSAQGCHAAAKALAEALRPLIPLCDREAFDTAEAKDVLAKWDRVDAAGEARPS